MKTSRKPDEHDKAKGRDLARLRKAAGISQERLARQLGISTKQLGKYERGQSRMPAGRHELALQILRMARGKAGGFAEDQAPFVDFPRAKETLLKELRDLEDYVRRCIDAAERL